MLIQVFIVIGGLCLTEPKTSMMNTPENFRLLVFYGLISEETSVKSVAGDK